MITLVLTIIEVACFVAFALFVSVLLWCVLVWAVTTIAGK